MRTPVLSMARLAVAVAVVTALAVLSGCRPVQVTGTAGSPAVRPPTAASAQGGSGGAPAPQHTTRAPATHAPAPPKPVLVMAKGTTSGQVRELQARLHMLSYFDRSPTGFYGDVTTAAVSAFQGAHGLPRTGGTDRATWQRLLALTHTPSHDELFPPTALPWGHLPRPSGSGGRPDPRCLTGRALCISKKSRSLSWIIDGRTVSQMDVRFGSEYTPTREGAFKVFFRSRHHVSTIYHTPMPYAMFFSGGQAVHYSSDFAARGYAGASHGCVNVRDKQKIAALFDQVRTGDKVIVY
ncbi:L,D-transpeptidase family protein [Streptomyces sp. TS71-3]|uniref:L,D-transpeptidase family protein n=1 Tax=Streptomyces sp. TS71-3 TaxID=2733862 RepID=UPI001B1BD964|nr:L,D-transpeptidase family protein [Streptomyces sp. TS71-3]GHJ35192.1 lipoprotein [Streptomyces sp. TS71-3]